MGQAAAAKQLPLGIRDAALLAKSERRQQGGMVKRTPALGRGPQPAFTPTRRCLLNIYHPTQIAGGGDPLAQQQTPPIQPRLVGQTVSRFQRGHQGDPAAYRHGG